MNIRKFSNLNKSKIFIVVFPSNENFNSNDLDSNSFTHERVILVNNFTIYRLETPYKKRKRKFIVQENFFDDRKEYLNFGGKHLKAAAIDCTPHNYWRKDENTINFKQEEIICDHRNDDQKDCSLYFR